MPAWRARLCAVRSPGRGRTRVVRGLVLSAACLMVPAVGHVIAGGGAPAMGPFLFAAALLSAACVALADRRLATGEVAMLLFASQPVLHVLLSLSGHGTAVIAPGPGMVLAHLLAASALTVLLAGSESVLWAMAALSATVLLRQVRALLGPIARLTTAPRLSRQSADTGTVYVLHVTRIAPRRGPPALSST